MKLKKIAGLSFISVMISVSMIAGSLLGLATIAKTSKRKEMDLNRKLLAESYVAELIETFQTKRGTALLNYMKVNPSNGALPPYPLCAHINILNRAAGANGTVVNPDPNVTLPVTPLDGKGGARAANRFYLVQVVDVSVTPPIVKTEHCNKTALTYVGGSPTERLQITAGISWLDPNAPVDQTRRLALTMLVPEW